MKNICFQMSRRAWLAIAMAVMMAVPVLAQTVTVTGTVYEPDGEPAIGAAVIEKGKTQGVITDFDGNYTIKVSSPNATIEFSYIGMETQTIALDGRTHVDITLSAQSTALDELVVVGYGTVKKEDATGSVAVIKPDDIEAGIATSTQDLLVGASPGVVVTTNGGNPTGSGTIRIRGGSSLSASNDPLIVVDGVPLSNQSNAGGTNALTMINPQNIESMTILKDASATAIYGSRASNGVIIITTKKGKSGRPQVNFAANFHVNTARNTLSMMNASEFTAVVMEHGNDVAQEALTHFGEGYNTNWQDEVLRTTFSQDYSLSVGGSVGALPYRVNASFTDNQGILKTSGMQRTTAGINLSPKFFDGLLQVNANVSGTYISSREADGGAIGAAITMSPTLPVRYNYPTVDGNSRQPFNGYTNFTNGSGASEVQSVQNPVQMLMDRNNTGETWQSNGNLQIDYALHFLPELHLNLNLGYQVSKNESETIVEQNSIMAWRNDYSNGAGTRYNWYELQRNTLLDFYANYKKEFDAIRSNLDVMAGYSWQHFDYHGRSQNVFNTLGYYNSGANFFADGKYNLMFNEDTNQYVGHSFNNAPKDHWGNPLQLLSFFGRLNYSFDDTYLLTFTLRDDASSRFDKDHRWGLFPSLALGWKLINMGFMEGAQSWMNDFKLRLGWGITGQQDINSHFPYMAVYTISDRGDGKFKYPSPNGDGTWICPIYPNAYARDIKWEETTTWNVGLDLAFLNNRITANLDWYLRDTNDLLANTPIASVNTSNYMMRNIGSLRNYGVEATISAKPVVTRDFVWTSAINVAWNRNRITKLTGDAETSQIKAADTPSGTGGGLQYHIVGEPASSFLVYQQVYDKNGDPVPGQYVDQNGDGKIDDNDKIIYHSPDPKVTMSWNNNFSYKNWDFGITLRANLGNYVYNGPRYSHSRVYSLYGYNLNNLLNDTYLFTEQDNNLSLSNYFVEDASFVRCDNITIGYTFDNLLHNNLNLRLFGAVQNPFVITKYKGLDPEVFGGIDNNVYPRPITATIGLVATF